jgi:hypothetical protein
MRSGHEQPGRDGVEDHPKTNDVVDIQVGSSPESVVFGDGSGWVAVHAL